MKEHPNPAFTLTVDNVNDTPEFTFISPTSTDEDTAFSYQLTASDIDLNDVLTCKVINLPDYGCSRQLVYLAAHQQMSMLAPIV